MAITQFPNKRIFEGLSTDDKTLFEPFRNGDSFQEMDSGKTYKYSEDGDTWIEQPTGGTVTIGAGTALIGKVSIDQATANANEVVTKTGSVTTATLSAETTKVIGTTNDKIADGDDTTQGSKTDAPATTGTTDAWSVIAMLKGIWNKLAGVGIAAGTNLIGKISIDQVTPNANEIVTKNGSVTEATLATETTKVIGTVNDKVADGDDITLGAKADAPATIGDVTPFSAIALLKGIWNKLGAVVLTTSSAIIGKVSIDQVTSNANEVVTKTGSITTATLATETTKVIGTVNNKVADGDDSTLGSKTDAASITGDTTSSSVIAMLKGIWNKLGAVVLTTGTSIIGKVSIDQVTANANEVVVKTLPAANLGEKAKAASLAINPANDISDGIYIGDIKFGEELPAGTQLIGKTGIDQTVDGTTNKVQARNTTHGDFQANATIQINDTDVSNTNPVSIIERKTSVAPSASPVTVDTTGGGTTIAAANANRLSITLQNNGTEPCIVRLGGDPTTAAYNLVLPADTSARQGEGGSWTSNKYTGAIKGLTEANSTAISVIEEVIA